MDSDLVSWILTLALVVAAVALTLALLDLLAWSIAVVALMAVACSIWGALRSDEEDE